MKWVGWHFTCKMTQNAKIRYFGSEISNISTAKNKVPWVDKLFQDVENKLKKRGFWNFFILLCHLCSKLRKFQLFTKCKGRQRGRVPMYVSSSLLCVIHVKLRPKKKLCLFPVTCLKILGSVGRKNLFFYFLFFFLKKSWPNFFFPTNFDSFTSN